MKQTNNPIASGIDGLRAHAMPNPPAAIVTAMAEAIVPKFRRPTRRVLAFAVAGGACLATMLLLPQNSAASIGLERLVVNARSSEAMYHITSYWVTKTNREPKIGSGYVKGQRWHYLQPNYEQASDGKTVIAYSPSEGRAWKWTPPPGEADAKTVLPSTDLSWWMQQDPKKLTVEHNVLWEGNRVDKYSITTHSQAWGPTKNTLYADPVNNRPLYGEYTHTSGNGSATKWDYLNPEQASVLEINLPEGTPIEDITAEKARAKQVELASSKASDN